jgi:ribosomal protein S17E
MMEIMKEGVRNVMEKWNEKIVDDFKWNKYENDVINDESYVLDVIKKKVY